MLLIPTYLAPSSIHGIGVFAACDVKAGTPIWEFNEKVDQKFSDGEFLEICEHMCYENEQKIRSWSYFENGVWILCGDNAKFFNHDEDNPSTNEQHGVMTTTAKRDLIAGDELTCNYKDFDEIDRKVEGKLYA